MNEPDVSLMVAAFLNEIYGDVLFTGAVCHFSSMYSVIKNSLSEDHAVLSLWPVFARSLATAG